MVPPSSDRVSRVRPYSGSHPAAHPFVYGSFTLFALTFQSCSTRMSLSSDGPKPRVQAPGLASFPFARRYLGNRVCFLFLRVLRCFSSPRCLMSYYFTRMTMPEHYLRRVPPFGYLRISGYVLLPAAFRSLSRPSSAPSAKASALCPSLLGLFPVCRAFAFHTVLLGCHTWRSCMGFLCQKTFPVFRFLGFSVEIVDFLPYLLSFFANTYTIFHLDLFSVMHCLHFPLFDFQGTSAGLLFRPAFISLFG